jgi:hypothetical protein
VREHSEGELVVLAHPAPLELEREQPVRVVPKLKLKLGPLEELHVSRRDTGVVLRNVLVLAESLEKLLRTCASAAISRPSALARPPLTTALEAMLASAHLPSLFQ